MEYKDILKNEMGDYYDEKLIENLENMGFFEAPASTKFHGNYRGGLFQHSLEVMRQLVCLTKNNALSWEDPRSPYIVGLLHDLCKYDQYSVRLDGKIEWINDQEYSGHGEKSAILCLVKLGLDLTEEESLCIRWHMGAFDEKEKWNGYTKAIHKYPNVLWTHTADMLASHVVGI